MLQIKIIQPDRLERFNVNSDLHKLLPFKASGDENNIIFENSNDADINIVSSFHLKQLYKNEQFSEIENIGKKILIIDNIHEHLDITDLENISKYLEKKPIVFTANILLYNSDLCYTPSKEFAIYQFYDVLHRTDFIENRKYDVVSFNNAVRPYRDSLVNKLLEKKKEFDVITYLLSDIAGVKEFNKKFEWKHDAYIDVQFTIANSYLNVYSESMFSQKHTGNQSVKVTEKTYWNLVTGTPFLSFEYNNDKLDFLKSFGFYTFDDLNLFPNEDFDYNKTVEFLNTKIDYIYNMDLIEYFNNNIVFCKNNNVLSRNILENYNFKEDFTKLLDSNF